VSDQARDEVIDGIPSIEAAEAEQAAQELPIDDRQIARLIKALEGIRSELHTLNTTLKQRLK